MDASRYICQRGEEDLWRDAHRPQMYDPTPKVISIHFATSRFSVPWSPLTRFGLPCCLASWNRSRTVAARLLLCVRAPVINLDFPSMKRWVTILYRIRPSGGSQNRSKVETLERTMLAVVMPKRIYCRNIINSPLDSSPPEASRDATHSSEGFNNSLT